ncbi:MAG: MBL fold metallo-hydrolase [bacterium]
MRVCVLGSGSGGNCTLVEGEHVKFLIDAGRLSMKYICTSLEKIGVRIEDVSAILATHAHGDHIDATTYKLIKKYDLQLYVHEDTFPDVKRRCWSFHSLEDSDAVKFFSKGAFFIDNMRVEPIEVPHGNGWNVDIVGRPVGFVITQQTGAKTKKIGFATDLGDVPTALVDAFADADAILLESNHKVEWELSSGRPDYLINWVLSGQGHLSNEQAGKAIVEIIRRSTKPPAGILLAHISRRCNSHDVALRTARAYLKTTDYPDIPLEACSQREISPVIEI